MATDAHPRTRRRGRSSRLIGLSFALASIVTSPTLLSPAAASDVGTASFYGRDHAGKRTASGMRFNPEAMTAAHRKLPFGSRLRVTNLRNGRTVVVSISDRGPFTRNRIIDLSLGAARELDFVRAGTARVKLDRL